MHRTATLALCALLAATAAAGLAGAQTTDTDQTVTVTLRVAPAGFVAPSHWAVGNPAVWLIDPAQETAFNDAPGVAGCDVAVADGDSDGAVTGAQVLDAATAQGCISGWSAESSDFGRFVTSVDGLHQIGWPATWWSIYVDGSPSPVGIDAMALETGQSLEFVYTAG